MNLNPLINDVILESCRKCALAQAVRPDVLLSALLAIVGLLLPSLPSAIFWRVAFGVVNPAKCQTFIRLAHVEREPLETFIAASPLIADRNPTASVVSVVVTAFVVASLHHALPAIV